MLQAMLAALQPRLRPNRRRQHDKRRDVQLEILKLLKCRALSRRQVRQELGFSELAVHKACAELEAQGFLVTQVADELPARKGRLPLLFTVAPAWGGKAQP